MNILRNNWDEHCDSGTVTKIYFVAQKLVAAIGYTISSCFSKAFIENGITLNQDEKDEIDKTMKPENIPKTISNE